MTIAIHPHEIGQLLDRFPQATCLSLDCFDTLLWRDCHAPADLFAALPGINRGQRADAERRARKAQALAGRGTEVTIGQIYATLMPNASAAERDAAIAAELDAEARHCQAFAPTVDLMRAARARGMQIIIVSDTYFDETQLRNLIALSAGEDVAAMIDALFASSTHGVSKAGGLYRTVLEKLDHPPEGVVHLGDNFTADVGGVAPLGVQAVHLVQFDDDARAAQRLEAGVDAMVHTGSDKLPRPYQPHRAALGFGLPQLACPAQRLGASVLGSVLHAYDMWLRGEADALKAKHGGKVHWLFLMRDGHLPQRVHTENGAGDNVHAAEISRFTATAAHLAQDGALETFLAEELGQRPQSLARQLLMDEARIESLLGGLDMEEGSRALLKESRTGPFRKATRRKARAMADRLEAHVRQLCNPAKGDVLMLVDLGYNGTVQNRVAALLEERLGVHVAGRYLLLRERDCPGLDKTGLIDARHYPPELLEAMCANVALLEQLCSKDCGSVRDYAEDGTPIRGENDIDHAQSAVREAAQQGALAFQRWAEASTIRTAAPHAAQMWREAAASVLMRVMYLPTPAELQVVDQFQHDVNLGTDRVVPLFDRAIAGEGLRQRGLFYMNGSQRMYLPAEVAGEAMETRLALLAQRRFNLPFTFADCAGEALQLPVVFHDGQNASRRLVEARPTHDGYYTAAIPVGQARFAVAPQFAELFEWVELERLAFVPVKQFISGTHEELRCEWPAHPHYDAMASEGGRLLDCRDAAAQMLVPPPQIDGENALLLACTFRPLVRRRKGKVLTQALSA
ncbi:HAD family hydrolase [Aurantiacibacter odishensis]|uniref:HAD family hydrolase n=1 Tax=Aurantiacibacter odishensis TaxID=1155476 RepID=UPI000E737A48|nr:HAD family hydrolase [Aurantiacibacter odishensis]